MSPAATQFNCEGRSMATGRPTTTRVASTREAKEERRRDARDRTRISLRSIADDGDGDVVRLARWCVSMHVRRRRPREREAGRHPPSATGSRKRRRDYFADFSPWATRGPHDDASRRARLIWIMEMRWHLSRLARIARV